MADLPSVGIIIPNYNYSRFVGAAIESALAQTHPDVRIIVIDDGSTDDSRQVIERYAGRVRAVFQANTGHFKACLAAWRLLDTTITMFLDSDDMLAPDAAQTIAEAWRPGVSKVQFELEVVDAEGKLSGVTFPKYPPDMSQKAVYDELLRTAIYPCPPTTGNAYATSLLAEVPQTVNVPWIDSTLNILVPLVGEVVTVRKRLGFYRNHGDNAWQMRTLKPDQFVYRMHVEERRTELLGQFCAERGIPFDVASALRHMPSYQEHRVVVAKFSESAARPGRWAALRAMLHTINVNPYSLRQKALRTVWAVAVTYGPPSFARNLVVQRFNPLTRAGWVETFLDRLLGRRAATPKGREALGVGS